MKDTIYRQEAIDELKKISFSHWFECGEYLSEDTREIEIISSSKALEAIEALPSAQPEPQWIPVEERLPEENGAYLVNVSPYYLPPESGQIDLLIFVDGKWMFWDVTEAKEFPEPIIAWMPLPEPWRGEEP